MVGNRNLFIYNNRIVVLHTTAPSIGSTVKVKLFFLRLIHKYIKYWARELQIYILGLVSDKCTGFYKYLRFTKSGFVAFSNYSGHQKGPTI